MSYRREGSGDAAGRLTYHLRDRFGAERVFMDVDAIEPGMDYVEAITRAVEACDVLVAVIGPGWLTAANIRGRLIDDPRDWVRMEVGTALARDVRVIPVLVGNAAMPRRAELPENLAGLARRNALRVRHESFRDDAARLIAAIERALAPAAVDNESPWSSGDPARAERLFRDAERVAESITDEYWKAAALRDVARAMAATNPDDAERIAESITGGFRKAPALGDVAKIIAATNPDRADRLSRDAERLANAITDGTTKAQTMSNVAAAMAATNPSSAPPSTRLNPSPAGWGRTTRWPTWQR